MFGFASFGLLALLFAFDITGCLTVLDSGWVVRLPLLEELVDIRWKWEQLVPSTREGQWWEIVAPYPEDHRSPFRVIVVWQNLEVDRNGGLGEFW